MTLCRCTSVVLPDLVKKRHNFDSIDHSRTSDFDSSGMLF